MVDPITVLATVKGAISAGRSLSSLSKEIGNFFDATDAAKKKLQKKGVSGKNVNAIAMERFSKLRQAAEAEEELKKFICESLGPSHWQTLLKIRREVLQEKRDAEAHVAGRGEATVESQGRPTAFHRRTTFTASFCRMAVSSCASFPIPEICRCGRL